MTRRIAASDRYALYDHAHHDLWWARSQQWSAANWALLLMAAIVGIGHALTPPCGDAPPYLWILIVFVGGVALSAAAYIARLHNDIVHNRFVYRELERQTGIDSLRKVLDGKGLQAADARTDCTRGLGLLYPMTAVIGLGTGVAALLLGTSFGSSLRLGADVAVVNAAFLGYVTLNCPPQKPSSPLPPSPQDATPARKPSGGCV